MVATFIDEFTDIERRIRKSELYAICDIINAKDEQYRKLLDNGNEIYMQVRDDRLEKMYELRNALWNKRVFLQELINEIIETRG